MHAETLAQAQDLGRRLVAAKLIAPWDVNSLLEEVRETGVRLEWLLEDRRVLSVRSIALSLWPRALSADLQVPPREVLDLVPVEWAYCHLVLPLHSSGVAVSLAMENPCHPVPIRDIQTRTGLEVNPFGEDGVHLYATIQRFYGPLTLPGLKTISDPAHPGHAFLCAFKEFWGHLQNVSQDRFSAFIDRWVTGKGIHPATGELLKALFGAIQSEHAYREGDVSCYLPALSDPDSVLKRARKGLVKLQDEAVEHLYARWNMLRRHSENLDAATVATLHASNLRDLHLYRVAQKLSPKLQELREVHREDPDAVDFVAFLDETQAHLEEVPDMACDEVAWLLSDWSLD
jgi:hypothetical protein